MGRRVPLPGGLSFINSIGDIFHVHGRGAVQSREDRDDSFGSVCYLARVPLGMQPNQESGPAVLLYDGECGLCTRIVQFVLRVEAERTLRFAPLAGEFARDVLSRHRELAGVDSIVWVAPASEPSRELVLVRSEAAIHLGLYLGGGWRVLAHLARFIPLRLRDRLYDWVARRRRRWFAGATTCLVLNNRQRDRLIS